VQISSTMQPQRRPNLLGGGVLAARSMSRRYCWTLTAASSPPATVVDWLPPVTTTAPTSPTQMATNTLRPTTKRRLNVPEPRRWRRGQHAAQPPYRAVRRGIDEELRRVLPAVLARHHVPLERGEALRAAVGAAENLVAVALAHALGLALVHAAVEDLGTGGARIRAGGGLGAAGDVVVNRGAEGDDDCDEAERGAQR
jgi:hypothetical protein